MAVHNAERAAASFAASGANAVNFAVKAVDAGGPLDVASFAANAASGANAGDVASFVVNAGGPVDAANFAANAASLAASLAANAVKRLAIPEWAGVANRVGLVAVRPAVTLRAVELQAVELQAVELQAVELQAVELWGQRRRMAMSVEADSAVECGGRAPSVVNGRNEFGGPSGRGGQRVPSGLMQPSGLGAPSGPTATSGPIERIGWSGESG